MKNVYKVIATFLVPKLIVPLENESVNGFPDQLVEKSRIISNTTVIDGIDITIKPSEEYTDSVLAEMGALHTEAVDIDFILDIATRDKALSKSDIILEGICDDLAFRLQMPIYIRALKIRSINTNEDGLLFAFPNGYQHEKFINSIRIDSISEINPILRNEYFNLDTEYKAALRMYHKALIAQFEIDKFIFFYIAAEILSKKNKPKIKEYIKNYRCGHDIEKCPVCGVSTEKEVLKASVKSYLINECGISKKDANLISEYRNFLHGSSSAIGKNNQLAKASRDLQYAVTHTLKTITNISESSPPLIDRNAPIMANIALTFINNK